MVGGGFASSRAYSLKTKNKLKSQKVTS